MSVKHTSYIIKCTRNQIFVLSTPVRPQNLIDFFHSHNCCHSNVPLHSGVLCRHLFDSFHWFHDLICREGLLHLPVLVHLVDALGDCNGHLLGRHPIVLPFCDLFSVQNTSALHCGSRRRHRRVLPRRAQCCWCAAGLHIGQAGFRHGRADL